MEHVRHGANIRVICQEVSKDSFWEGEGKRRGGEGESRERRERSERRERKKSESTWLP